MTDDVFRKVGRGGAGNFYPATTPDDASRDLEAQTLSTSVVPPPDRSSAQAPARAGRGGAGNYVEPANLPDARETEEMADKTAAAVAASLKRDHGRGGLGGRGGAGNWVAEDKGAALQAQAEQKEKLNQKVRDEVETGLAMPAKVHHGTQKHQR